MKQFISTKAFICYQDKVLVLRQSSEYEDGNQPGKYEIPGGRIDPGEPWRDAFFREIWEETGLDVRLGRPFHVGEWWPEVRDEKWHIIGTYFECFANSSDVVLSQDHDDFVWIDPREYDEINLLANTTDAFEAYLEHRGITTSQPRSHRESSSP